MVDVRTAGHLEFHTKPRIFVAGSAGVRRTQFAASFPKPIVADCGANQAELALSGADYAIINSESDLFDLVLELEGDTTYQTLVLDALDGFQDVLLDERLETEHRNELEAGDWKWLEGRLRTIFKRLKTLSQNLVVVRSIRDTMVRDATVFQDQVCSGRVRWQTFAFTEEALSNGCELVDRMELISYRPQPKGRSQVHARRNHSTLLIFKRL